MAQAEGCQLSHAPSCNCPSSTWRCALQLTFQAGLDKAQQLNYVVRHSRCAVLLRTRFGRSNVKSPNSTLQWRPCQYKTQTYLANTFFDMSTSSDWDMRMTARRQPHDWLSVGTNSVPKLPTAASASAVQLSNLALNLCGSDHQP